MVDFDAPTPAEIDLRAYVGAIAADLGVPSGGVTSEVCSRSTHLRLPEPRSRRDLGRAPWLGRGDRNLLR